MTSFFSVLGCSRAHQLVEKVGESKLALARRQRPNCVGWHCLTTAEQFGIVFSVVIVSIVLLLAWMYLLGRMGMSQQRRKLVRLPGGRAGQSHSQLPPDVALGHMPQVQQWPGYPPQVVYHPSMYYFTPGQVSRAQPYIGAGSYAQQPMPSPYPTPPYRPLIGYHGPEFSQTQQEWPRSHMPQPQFEQRQDAASASQRPREPNWRQRLSRLFRVPVGRASTISGSSLSVARNVNSPLPCSIVEPEQLPQDPTQKLISREVPSPGPGLNATYRAPAPVRFPERDSKNVELDEVESLQTNVATVHSDDFLIAGQQAAFNAPVYDQAPPGGTDGRHDNLYDEDTMLNASAVTGHDRRGSNESIPSVSTFRFQAEKPPPLNVTKAKDRATGSHRRNVDMKGNLAGLLRRGGQRNHEESTNGAREGPKRGYTVSESTNPVGARRPCSLTSNQGVKYQPELRKSTSREQRERSRKDWENRQSSASDEGELEPCAPHAIHQGGGDYHATYLRRNYGTRDFQTD